MKEGNPTLEGFVSAQAGPSVGAYLSGWKGSQFPGMTVRQRLGSLVGRIALEHVGFLGLMALTIALRVFQIETVPPGMHYDESANGIDALRVLGGELPVFFSGNEGRESLFIYLTSLSFSVLGVSTLSMRLVAVITGIVTVGASYFLMRELLGRRLAFLATFLFATSFWHIALSRIGFRAGMVPLFEILAAYFLLLGWRQGRTRWFAASGMALGLAMYTYTSARTIPLWLGPIAVAPLLPWWRGRLSARRYGANLAALGVVAGIVLAPLGLHFFQNPDDLGTRLETASPVWMQPDGLRALGESVLLNVGDLIVRGDSNPRLNLPGRPVFDPIVGAVFLLGVGVSLWRLRDVRYTLLLLWTIAMMLPGILSGGAPNALRLTGIMPAIFAFPAIGLIAVYDWVSGSKVSWRHLVAMTVVGLVAGVGAALAIRDYFVDWAGRPDTYYGFEADAADALRVASQLAGSGTVILAGEAYRGATVPYALMPGGNGGTSLTVDSTYSLLFPAHPTGDVFYVIPRSFTEWDGRQRKILPKSALESTFADRFGGAAGWVYRFRPGEVPRPKPTREASLQFGGHIEIYGYDLVPWMATTGIRLLTVYGRVVKPFDDGSEWEIAATLHRSSGERVGTRSVAHLAAPDQWSVGDELVVWLDLFVQREEAPGSLDVNLEFVEPVSSRRLTAFDGAGRDLGESARVARIQLAGPSRAMPAAAKRLRARLGDNVELLGYELGQSPRAGRTLHVVLYWQAIGPITEDYTVFAHLVDAKSRRVGQQDHPPQAGGYPTSRWRPGDVVKDEYFIPIDSSLAGSRATLMLGMYRPGDMTRLPIRDAAGGAIGDNLNLPISIAP